MLVPKVNHRYCGWRESVKIVSPVKCGLSNIFRLSEQLRKDVMDYNNDYPPLLAALTDDLNLIQSARVLIDYFKEST